MSVAGSNKGDIMTRCRFAAAVAAFALLILPARGAEVLRVAMTAADIPTTTGMPNNGFEGMRFLGYPIFEGLVLWDLASADRLAGLRPGSPNDMSRPQTGRPGCFTCATG
jgi:peptide/nickel transport system substrate-binding protein